MGGTSGHVSLGFVFLSIGLWHLFNSIKLHSLNPKSYISLPWYPISRLRYLEPILIMSVTSIYVISELFIGKNVLAHDGTIPYNHLRQFEHSIIAMSFFVYAFFAILLEEIRAPAKHGLVHFLQAVAFGQQLLILHLHSTDHIGVEGQYHFLLQIVTFVSLITTIFAIGYPRSFLNSFVRCSSVILLGVWLVVTGITLWTPRFLPKGCVLKSEMGRVVVQCHGDRALERAKALVNIQFGWYLIGLTIFSVSFYLVIILLYLEEKMYQALTKYEDHEHDENCTDANYSHETKLQL